MPGLEAMKKTVSIPVIREFTVIMGRWENPWKGPAGPAPLTRPEGAEGSALL